MTTKRPTVEELDQILNAPPGTSAVDLNPDGSITTVEFRKELESLINRHCKENGSSTPDFILAEYLIGCLWVFDKAVVRRAGWYGRVAGGPILENARPPDNPETTKNETCIHCGEDIVAHHARNLRCPNRHSVYQRKGPNPCSV